MQYVFIQASVPVVDKAWKEFASAADIESGHEARIIPAMGGAFLVMLEAGVERHLWGPLNAIYRGRQSARVQKQLADFAARFQPRSARQSLLTAVPQAAGRK